MRTRNEQWIEERIERPIAEGLVASARLDPTLPETFMWGLDGAMRAAVARAQPGEALSEDALRSFLLDPERWAEYRVALDESVRDAKSRARQADTRWSLLWMLVREAEANVPFVGLAILGPSARPDEFLRRVAPLPDLIAQARATTGERRLQHVVRLVKDVAERVYAPYLRVLCQLQCCRMGRPLKMPPPFGPLAEQLRANLPHAGLVHPQAGLFRNACVHEHVRYVPPQDRVLLRDERSPWQSFPVDELLAAALEMHALGGVVLPAVSQLYFLRTIQRDSGLFDPALLRAVLGPDWEEVRQAADELERRWKKALTPLGAYLARPGSFAAAEQPVE